MGWCLHPCDDHSKCVWIGLECISPTDSGVKPQVETDALLRLINWNRRPLYYPPDGLRYSYSSFVLYMMSPTAVKNMVIFTKRTITSHVNMADIAVTDWGKTWSVLKPSLGGTA